MALQPITWSGIHAMAHILFAAGNLLLAAYFFYTILAIWRGAPPIPTLRHVRKTMLELAEIKPGYLVVDLGSGDGRMLIAAARAGGTAIGYELNPFLYWFSKVRVKLLGLSDQITIYRENLFTAPFEEVDVITAYLGPKLMNQLEPIVKERMKPGSRFIANTFPFPNLIAKKQSGKVYQYIVEGTELP